MVGNVDGLKARAKGMSAGLEPELSAVIDVFFPIEALTEAAREFRERFPRTPLRLYVEALGGAYQAVLDGRAGLGVVAELPIDPPRLTAERLQAVPFVFVAASGHPLAAVRGPIPRQQLARHVQLVITDRTELTQGRDFGVLSPETWRFADVSAKRAFLLKGLGWGGMPLHLVSDDLASGRLAQLAIEDIPPEAMALPMAAVYPPASPPGPAGRWLIERLKMCPASPVPPARRCA